MIPENAGVDGGIFDLLNAHATLVANGQITPDITSAFQTFRIQANESFLQPPNHDLTSPLGLAYSRFWEVHFRQTRR